MRLAVLAAASLAFAAAAQAEPATPDGALAMSVAYAAYLPPAMKEKQVVSVTPDGDDYVVSWDIEKALAALGAPDGAVQAAPFFYRVTPTPGGGWLMLANALPYLVIAPAQQGARDGGTVGFDGFRFDGVYDPAAPEFFRGKLGLDALKADLKTKSGEHWRIDQKIASDLRVRTGAAPETFDIALTQTSPGSTQTTPLAEARQGAAAGDDVVTGLRAKAFGDLWRFLVAHANEDRPPPEELKTKLLALAPLWKQLGGKIDLDHINLDFRPSGFLRIKSAKEDLKLTGLAATSAATLRLALGEVALDYPTLPEWLKSVWPASLALTLDVGADGLDEIAGLVLNDPEFLNYGGSSEATKAKAADLFTQGRPHVSLSAGRLSTPLVEATFEGEASFGEEGPAAHAKITADTLDKVLETLAKAVETQPSAQQALYLVTYARGLAKTQDGRMVWDIEVLDANSVEVNGQKFPPQ